MGGVSASILLPADDRDTVVRGSSAFDLDLTSDLFATEYSSGSTTSGQGWTSMLMCIVGISFIGCGGAAIVIHHRSSDAQQAKSSPSGTEEEAKSCQLAGAYAQLPVAP